MDTCLIIIGEFDWSTPGPFGIPVGIGLFALWLLSQLKGSNEKVAREEQEGREEREKRENQAARRQQAQEHQAAREEWEKRDKERQEREACDKSLREEQEERESRIRRSEERSASGKLTCRFCGRSVSSTDIECPQCGARKSGWNTPWPLGY